MDTLTLLYTISGIIFGLAFIPQIVTLLRDQAGAVSINLSTWAIFTLCNAVNVAYAFKMNGDKYFILCACICLVGNSLVLGIASWRKLLGVQNRQPALVSI